MIELRVPPYEDYGNLVAHVAQDAAARAQIADERSNDVAQAAKAGFELIVRAAMTGVNEPIRVRAAWTPAEFTVSLLERGLPLDDASARRDAQWSSVYSRVDRARWKLHGRSGSELELAIARPHGIAHDGEAPPAQESVPLAPQQSYTIRRFRAEDAPGVARAFFLTWGYRYIFPAVYVPDRLIQLNDANAYISMVAESESGEIVGHYALDPVPGAPIADGCAAIVVPAHRGRGLLERLREAAEREAVALNLAAYYSEPVTTHGRTQSESAKFGAKLCAIVLGGDPKSFVPKAMQYTGAGQRQSFTVYFKPLAQRERRSIYAPHSHRAMIERIYAQLNLPVDLRQGAVPTGDGDIHVSVVRGEGFASIDVAAVGATTAQQAVQAARDLRALEHLGALYANLPLEDPGTPELAKALEKLGFFFCGVIPWMLGGRDALRLQLPLTRIDLEQVTIVGDFGEQFKSYIAAQMRSLQ